MFRVGDDVRVEGDTWFRGATGYVRDVDAMSGTLLVELEEYGQRVQRGLLLPFTPSEVVSVRCQHTRVTEDTLRAYIDRRWFEVDPPYCDDCKEWLYPDDLLDGTIRVYVGEPRGAGVEL